MNISSLFVDPVVVEGQPSPMRNMGNANLSINIRKTLNGANVVVSGLGANEEYSVEQLSGETVPEFSARVKGIITESIEVS